MGGGGGRGEGEGDGELEHNIHCRAYIKISGTDGTVVCGGMGVKVGGPGGRGAVES